MHISIASKHRGRRHPRGFEPLRIAVAGLLAAQLAFLPLATAAGDKPASALAPVSTNDPVLRAMQTELARATTELGKSEQPPYYLSYTVYDQDFVVLAGAYGSLLGSNNVPDDFYFSLQETEDVIVVRLNGDKFCHRFAAFGDDNRHPLCFHLVHDRQAIRLERSRANFLHSFHLCVYGHYTMVIGVGYTFRQPLAPSPPTTRPQNSFHCGKIGFA